MASSGVFNIFFYMSWPPLQKSEKEMKEAAQNPRFSLEYRDRAENIRRHKLPLKFSPLFFPPFFLSSPSFTPLPLFAQTKAKKKKKEILKYTSHINFYDIPRRKIETFSPHPPSHYNNNKALNFELELQHSQLA